MDLRELQPEEVVMIGLQRYKTLMQIARKLTKVFDMSLGEAIRLTNKITEQCNPEEIEEPKFEEVEFDPPPKTKVISFKIPLHLFEYLKQEKNRSRLINNLISKHYTTKIWKRRKRTPNKKIPY